jgi:hypothetical protein
MTADPDLFFQIKAGERWAVRAVIRYFAGTGPDIGFNWTVPGSTSGTHAVVGLADSVTGQTGISQSFLYPVTQTQWIGGTGANSLAVVEASFLGQADGTVSFNWAQAHNPAVENTAIKADSYLTARRLA